MFYVEMQWLLYGEDRIVIADDAVW